ncbi:TIM barrel protein [Microlunatus elymi]|uniref:TIM barrel protein n=1 Tax=Microlunatus elymi TaxID=2596828 RepID=A0A516Q2R9_9ACTN|nr:TIM barrel protein [Microlunatus elymi]QDP97716.1 TIM barrel protein [Microlunatus elymi]
MNPNADSTAKSLHSWSLFRTLGRYVAPGSMPLGQLPEGGGGGLSLLDLPAELARHGYDSVQLCHFYLPSREVGYLGELRSAFDDAGVAVECLLIDEGDLADPVDGDQQRDWLSGWIDTAEQFGVDRVRVPAGKQPPGPDALRSSVERLVQLADRHPGTRIMIENWLAMMPDAASVNEILDRTAGRIGFLIDLGNWKGDGKYDELAAVAARAESCQAKVSTDASGVIDEADYRRSLGVLRDAGYGGPLAMVYDGPDPDEWGKLDQAYGIVRSVYA